MSIVTTSISGQIHTETAQWYAVRTRFKCEKKVSDTLINRSIEAYTPTYIAIRRWERKTRKVELPLLNCYVFVKIIRREYIHVLETQNVVDFLHFNKQLIPIPQQEIDLLRRVAGEPAYEVSAAPLSHFEPGEEVEIAYGLLTGTTGKLVEIQGKHRFIIELKHVGYALQISIDPKWLVKPGLTIPGRSMQA